MSDDPGQPDDARPYLWTADEAVLVGIVRQLEVERRDAANAPEIFAAVGLSNEEGHAAVARLDRDGLIDVGATGGFSRITNGNYLIRRVTGDGLRRSGAWPGEAERVTHLIMAALGDAADNEPDDQQRSRLRGALDAVGAVTQKTLTEIVASYLAKTTGA